MNARRPSPGASRQRPAPAAQVAGRSRTRLVRDLILVVLFAGLLLALPSILRSLYGQASVSYLSLGIKAVALAVLALTWDIVARTGQLSLAHAAFYGAGAYAAAVLFKLTGAPLWLGIPLAGVVAGLLALVLGSATLRLFGIYFAIASLAFTEVVKVIVQSMPFSVTGGTVGTNLPPLFRPVFVAGEMERWEVAFLRNQGYFLVYVGVLVLTIVISVLMQNSRLRHAFTAIRTNEFVAGVMGVNPARYKLIAFVVSSFLVGMLGAVEAHRFGSVNPDSTFAVHTTVLALVTPIFGGLYTTVGPILAAGVLSGVEETLKRVLSDGYLVAYGVVLVVSILFMPRGMVGLIRRLTSRREPQRVGPTDRADDGGEADG
ncbi:MAG TPA: branched-chain amino acid ABC transporter permease [Trueperaceae bacterium]|nr:branched-chain amino acid ABC transporter permease [Trueperaceae bacterium]